MDNRFLVAIRNLSEERRNDLYWFCLLAGLIPALRDNLLFPYGWLSHIGAGLALPPVANPFGPAILLLAMLLAGIAYSGSRARLMVVVPFVALFIADTEFGVFLRGMNTVYYVGTFALFLYFAWRAEMTSLPFVLFVILLIGWQSLDDLLAWPQILVFLAAASVSRIVVEAFRQNLPLARDLGRSNRMQLSGRTLLLWWPMLILIGIGWWGSTLIESGAQNLMYERGYVVPYCALDPLNPETAVPCPDGEPVLREGMFYEDLRDRSPNDTSPQYCWFGRQVYESAYPLPPDEQFICPADMTAESWQLTPLGFFDSLDKTVERRYELAGWEMSQKLRQVDLLALRSAEDADDAARDLYSIVPRTTGMTTSTCYFPDVACVAANVVINGLNSAYRKARARTEIRFINHIKSRADAGAATVQSVTADARASLQEHLNEAEARTLESIDRVHTAANLLRQILLLWLVVVTVKSLLYVFSRVIFDKSTDIDVDLVEGGDVVAEGRVSHLQEVNVPGNYPYNLYYKADYQPLGPAARFSIPQWRASVMSRIRFGAWHMSFVEMPMADEEGVTFNSVEAEHLIDWEMEEGEEVVFSYRNFVAINENVQLRTVISLRVATLLLGRIVFHTARCVGGPGRLILRTRGKPASAEQVRRSIPAARLVAWNRYARFSVDSHLTLADVFLNGFNLRRSLPNTEDGPQGILIVEADARDGGMLVGTLRFARNFLMPV